MAKTVIYETKGRAREFNELAINLFTGCGHRCIYCYGADVTHTDKAEFKQHPRPRLTLNEIDQSAVEWGSLGRQEKRPILLCFVTDPYQPIEAESELTRETIKILHYNGLSVTILTKGGRRAMRDFDLLIPGKDQFATTLTCSLDSQSLKWEPGAALPHERIESLKAAYGLGIETWVSLEPVIDPDDAIYLMHLTRLVVGHFKVGTMNYHPHGKTIDWNRFGWQIKREMDEFGVKYYLKQDLRREMGFK